MSTILYGLTAPADSGTGRVRPPQSPDTTAPAVVGGILAVQSRQLFVRFSQGREDPPEGAYPEQLLALTARSAGT